ncbi:ADP-ribose pyrophosphatase, mitochondrial [Denticeps clupeoides]|uniref:ADP-ribose pyrophosphatase, mitochondrial n=1 Tax=Denticeps clupeoides TaxID=299321 RepID=A0AAY4BCW9_9TELE|nr:ADP-ribose pyrophosphatase, mitochondrial [Denticeps clupeoides]
MFGRVPTWVRSVHAALALLAFPDAVRAAGTCKTSSTSFYSLCAMSTIRHSKARGRVYPGSDVLRFPVPDDMVNWDAPWPEYGPVLHTAPSVLAKPVWADPEIGSFSPIFNCLDGSVDRRSHEGDYRVEDGRPLNPHGRTGLNGRGLLGRWGPNHAADPIVTRWKRNSEGQRVHHPVSALPILQFISIMRKDCGEWAIPGGMVDPGERVSVTLQREFSEEALNSLEASAREKEQLQQHISQLFSSPGLQVYIGYVDDPRNTDNAWMETVAVNFHDEPGTSVSLLPLHPGDDAGLVSWMDVDSAQRLYASHSHFLETVAKNRHAHW